MEFQAKVPTRDVCAVSSLTCVEGRGEGVGRGCREGCRYEYNDDYNGDHRQGKVKNN